MSGLINGQSYSLAELFSGDRKIIIPDLQRDYCWGDSKHGESHNLELVSGFIDSLLTSFNQDNLKEKRNQKETQIGMFYAYHDETLTNLYLCDGQQRITTMYLLIGMLYKYLKNEKLDSNNIKIDNLKRCLISDYELHEDDQEPYLQYSIRESTLYFLSDLVCEFFLTQNLSPSIIRSLPWYFNEYDQDPSIQSMLKALSAINSKLGESQVDLGDFSDFLINKVKFFYFDMKNRNQGEEMFVVINTTGEYLTSSENIKPILLGNINNLDERKRQSRIWEEWEKWFWQNKTEGEKIADQGLKIFFKWYWQIKLLQEKYWKNRIGTEIDPYLFFTMEPKNTTDENENIEIEGNKWQPLRNIDEIDKYFKAYKGIVIELTDKAEYTEVLKSVTGESALNTILIRSLPLAILLPLIAFRVKYLHADIFNVLRRLKTNHFHKIRDERNNKHVDWRHVIEMIEQSSSPDDFLKFNKVDYVFKKIPNVLSDVSQWCNFEERVKWELDAGLVFKWENDSLLQGDLSPLLKLFILVHYRLDQSNMLEDFTLELKNLNFSEIESALLLEYEDYQGLSSQLENLYKVMIEMRDNIWYHVLCVRFNRLDTLWYGSWSFGRDHFEYKRWHEKLKWPLYQNWFYLLIYKISNEFEGDITFALKSFVFSILSQSEKSFLETKIDTSIIFDGNKLINDVSQKSQKSEKEFYFWHGLIWRTLLAIGSPSQSIEFEIVFDRFDRQNELNKYEFGNQLVWSKGYYDRSIKVMDQDDKNSLKACKYEDSESFIAERTQSILDLLTKAASTIQTEKVANILS